MLIIIISRSGLKLGHVGSKTRSLGQQATQVSDLGPLWPSCSKYYTGQCSVCRKGWYYFGKTKVIKMCKLREVIFSHRKIVLLCKMSSLKKILCWEILGWLNVVHSVENVTIILGNNVSVT